MCPARSDLQLHFPQNRHEKVVGKETTSVRTALRLHAHTFYSTVCS
jgi:hypothetical protein